MTDAQTFELFIHIIWSATLFGLSTGLLFAFIGKRG